ncbi:MAG: FN3 associated domain-containing protein, partial [Spirochaetia bacterium]
MLRKTSGISLLLLAFLLSPRISFAENGDFSDISLSPSPGEYGKNITLHIETSDKASEGDNSSIEYRFLESESSDFVEYSLPLRLTALPGEKREFTLEVREKTGAEDNKEGDGGEDKDAEAETTRVRYTIDKSPPPPPEIEGSHDTGNLQFTVHSPKTDKEVRTYYWSSLANSSYRALSEDSENFSIPWPEEILSAEITAYSMDTLGNYSAAAEKRVIKENYNSSAYSDLSILSPVEGTYVNHQKLVIEPVEAFEWIRYTLDGRDPAEEGVRYEEPTLLEAEGEYTLRIAGKRRSTGEIERKEQSYTVLTDPPEIDFSLPEDMPEDIRDNTLSLAPPESGEYGDEGEYRFFYSFEERDVNREDPEFTSAIELDLSAPSLHNITMRIGALHLDSGKMYQYRFFYQRDNRTPASPLIYPSKKMPFRESAEVIIPLEGNTDIFYTLDGTTPDRYSKEYEAPLEIDSPEDAEAGNITLRAVARSANDKMSAVSSKSLAYDKAKPTKPEILIEYKDDGSVQFSVNSSSNAEYIRYEVAYGEEDAEGMEVDHRSPVGSEQMTIEFPFGFKGEAVLKAAVEDAAGNLSNPSDPVNLDTDTIPPHPPSIEADNPERITLVPRDNRDNSGDTLMSAVISSEDPHKIEEMRPQEEDFSEYTEAIDLPERLKQEISEDAEEGENTARRFYKVYAYSLDDGDNKSRTVSTAAIKVDLREAQPVVFSGITEGESYRRTRALYVQSPQLEGEVRYEVLEQKVGSERTEEDSSNSKEGKEPRQPDSDSPAADEPILLSGEEDSRIAYTVKARTYLPSADSWSEVRTLSFIVDREDPVLPDLEKPVNGEFYNLPVRIYPPDLEYEDEKMWLLWSEEGELPDSVSEESLSPEDIRDRGRPLSAPVEIGPGEGEEKDYVLFTAVFDAAGNSTMSGEPIRFTVDRVPPELPSLEGVPDSGTADGPVTLDIDGGGSGEDPVRLVYELSAGYGEAIPPHINSREMEIPFTIESDDNRISRFRLLYRSVDRAGNISEETGRVAFSIDNRRPAPPEILLNEREHNLYTLSLKSRGDDIELRYGIDEYPDTVYSGPVLFDLSSYPLDSGTVKINALGLNDNGVKSKVESSKIHINDIPSPIVSGIEDGSIYNKNITVKPLGDIRYELSAASNRETLEEIPKVSMLSPQFKSPIRLSASEGQTVHYRLSLGIVDPHSSANITEDTYTVT